MRIAFNHTHKIAPDFIRIIKATDKKLDFNTETFFKLLHSFFPCLTTSCYFITFDSVMTTK